MLLGPTLVLRVSSDDMARLFVLLAMAKSLLACVFSGTKSYGTARSFKKLHITSPHFCNCCIILIMLCNRVQMLRMPFKEYFENTKPSGIYWIILLRQRNRKPISAIFCRLKCWLKTVSSFLLGAAWLDVPLRIRGPFCLIGPEPDSDSDSDLSLTNFGVWRLWLRSQAVLNMPGFKRGFSWSWSFSLRLTQLLVSNAARFSFQDHNIRILRPEIWRWNTPIKPWQSFEKPQWLNPHANVTAQVPRPRLDYRAWNIIWICETWIKQYWL